MKKSITVLFCLCLILIVQAQEKQKLDVPADVKSAFNKQYPTAQKVDWSFEKEGEFETEFVINGIKSSAVYDAKGTLIEAETEMKESNLPESIKAVLAKEFAGYKVNEIAKTTDAKGKVSYEMDAKKDAKTYELVFDVNGKLLQKKELKDDEED